MSDADCTSGREPRSIAASTFNFNENTFPFNNIPVKARYSRKLHY